MNREQRDRLRRVINRAVRARLDPRLLGAQGPQGAELVHECCSLYRPVVVGSFDGELRPIGDDESRNAESFARYGLLLASHRLPNGAPFGLPSRIWRVS